MLSNAYFLAKFRLDTAENESAKNLQKFQKNVFPSVQRQNQRGARVAEPGSPAAPEYGNEAKLGEGAGAFVSFSKAM